MSLFDELRCRYPLPIEGMQELLFQTEDTPAQFGDEYEIREDGTLWHEAYDTEDHSDPKAEGLFAICGMMTRVNQRWEFVPFTGAIRFYSTLGEPPHYGWIEFSSYFVAGHLNQLHLLEHRRSQHSTL